MKSHSYLLYTGVVEILSAKELSRYLKINEKKIYQLVRTSTLPHTKIGGIAAPSATGASNRCNDAV